MGLNISKGNMYDFVTHTWNAVKGICYHDCSYCYMKRWKNQKPVRLDEKEFKTDLGKGNFIFVGSSCDMFAQDIPEWWIVEVLTYCDKFDNKYLFQTKNPTRLLRFTEILPEHSVVCTTIESDMWHDDIMKNSPLPEERAAAMDLLSDTLETYVTIEPILDFDLPNLVQLIRECKPKQVNIGADSGNNNLPEPSKEKVLQLIEELKKFTTISKKKNLGRLI